MLLQNTRQTAHAALTILVCQQLFYPTLFVPKYVSMTAKGLTFISPNHVFYSNENYRKRTNNTASSSTCRRVCVNACKPFFLLREKVNVNELFISTSTDVISFCFTPTGIYLILTTESLLQTRCFQLM